jgi:hypothetical protein
MPFRKNCKHIQNNQNKKNNSLQTLLSMSSPNDKKNLLTERVSSFASLRANLTVETAMVLPVFLFAIYFMMYFTQVIKVQAEIGNEIYKQSKQLALYAYVYEKAESKGMIASGQIEHLVSSGFSNLYVKGKLKEELGEDYYTNNYIDKGISLMLSSYMQEDGMIDIVATYKIRIPCNFFQLNKIRVIQRARVRGWTGYENTSSKETKEETVYITQNGTVYHRDIACTHINLSISEVYLNDVKNLRNSSGGKYYECELCENEPNNGKVYITDTGDRYHYSRNCSGIRRGVIAVPISQVGGRGPCSRCGN